MPEAAEESVVLSVPVALPPVPVPAPVVPDEAVPEASAEVVPASDAAPSLDPVPEVSVVFVDSDFVASPLDVVSALFFPVSAESVFSVASVSALTCALLIWLGVGPMPVPCVARLTAAANARTAARATPTATAVARRRMARLRRAWTAARTRAGAMRGSPASGVAPASEPAPASRPRSSTAFGMTVVPPCPRSLLPARCAWAAVASSR